MICTDCGLHDILDWRAHIATCAPYHAAVARLRHERTAGEPRLTQRRDPAKPCSCCFRADRLPRDTYCRECRKRANEKSKRRAKERRGERMAEAVIQPATMRDGRNVLKK